MSNLAFLNAASQALICSCRKLPPFLTSPSPTQTTLSHAPAIYKSAVDPVLQSFHRRRIAASCSSAENPSTQERSNSDPERNFWSKWMMDTAEMRSRVAKLGLAAVLAYILFDGVMYTTFFVLAFLGYEKSTGKNPAANLQALIGIVVLMWTGNNITRPFRLAGAAALAPVIDKGLKRIQKYFNFPSLVYAFALAVSVVAASCLTIVGLLILSRWGK